MKKILVTGGTGFIGSNLIKKLNELKKYKISVLDLNKKFKLSDIKVSGAFYHGNILDDSLLDKALNNIDVVVHLAADTRVEDSIIDPKKNFEVNVIGTFKLLDTARKKRISNIILASTGGAILGNVEPPINEKILPKPISPYGSSKLCNEAYLSSFNTCYGLKISSLRFANVYGPGSLHKKSVISTYIKNILNKEPLKIYGDGNQKRDFVNVEDIVKGIILSIQKKKSGVFQFGSNVPTSINSLIRVLKKIVSNKYSIKLKKLNRRVGEIKNTWCDIKNAKKTLGYQSTISLEKGLTQTWQWFIENHDK